MDIHKISKAQAYMKRLRSRDKVLTQFARRQMDHKGDFEDNDLHSSFLPPTLPMSLYWTS
ncbi:uncharacterized protein N7529_004090 [Penicillium soppii]|uniref:uncharacterized protein n=1 Tax=Penicillium soppii TaxID=69789 RepID=UPI002548CD5F|nr:uncharacterized protein N7529_004090 [Penicillium soppii]KAJ5871737.1 hypothetical protein N7529_004090 [Penicillium soppii]